MISYLLDYANAKIDFCKNTIIFIHISLLANIIGHHAFIHELDSNQFEAEKMSNDIDYRIVGGTDAILGQFPYQVISKNSV